MMIKTFLNLFSGALLLMLFVSTGYGQELVPLDVSQHKAVHLMFQEKVKYCATGSKDVKYTATDNIIKLTATKQGFPETNLTVITEDNVLYSFLLLYKKDPRKLNLIVDKGKGKVVFEEDRDEKPLDAAVFAAQTPSADGNALKRLPSPEGSLSEEDFNTICVHTIQKEQPFAFVDNKHNVQLELYNIFEYGNYLFFSVHIFNDSKKPFEVAFANFQQADVKWPLGQVYRESLKKPVYVFNEKETINAGSKNRMIYIFEKFEIEDGKKLLLELGENDGRRFLSLSVGAKHINEATVLTL